MYGIVIKNFFNRKVIMYFFDFDGTLVKETKFKNEVQNICDYFSFKLAINPDAFETQWSILTSRPAQDRCFIEWVCKNSNAFPKYIITQGEGIPVVGTDTEFLWKSARLCDYKGDNPYSPVIYIDNKKSVRNKVKQFCDDAKLEIDTCDIATFVKTHINQIIKA